ncbi:MAG TPA: rod-binding protein [Terriglobales bacterium]|jgi:Rod binding domain-containing protein
MDASLHIGGSLWTGVSPPDSTQRVHKATQEFEAQLLSSLLAPLEQSFSTAPGEEKMAGADDYHSMATQALASALSASGGIGIAAMLARQLRDTKVPEPR